MLLRTPGKLLGSQWEPFGKLLGSLWEASLLSCHFHPSVAKFSKSLSEISYKGDPCKDFSLGPFLDRFAYRNPKSKERLKKQFKLGESVAERKSGGRGLKAAAAVPVNDPKFLQRHMEVIALEGAEY